MVSFGRGILLISVFAACEPAAIVACPHLRQNFGINELTEIQLFDLADEFFRHHPLRPAQRRP